VSDIVIRNATLYSGIASSTPGAGIPPTIGDVSIRGERIDGVGEVPERGSVEIDAQGLALSPGFIDVHTHDDFAAVLHPEMAFKVRGGVTTCVVGNCGFGAAPHPQAALMARAFHPHDTLPEWTGYAGYVAHLEANPASVNVGVLVGHGTVRLGAMGAAKRAPDADEMQRMQAHVREGLEAGALGLSSGLVYEPGRHAKTDEIISLASLMAETGGLYATHMRNEGARLLEAVAEAIEVGERAGVPVQISHHKASGPANWGRVRESIQLIEAARLRGVDVHADQYPYTAGSTVLSAVAQDQDKALVDDPKSLERIVIASTSSHPEWEGKTLEELGVLLSVTGTDIALRVLDDEPGATVVLHTMDEDDVRTVMRHPTTMIGSDGIPTLEGKPHPRLYGTFARVIGHYARDLGLFPLEDAIHRMTGMSARKFGLQDRGELRAGAYADLVLFDPDVIIDRGTFEDPNRHPDGIERVFVNGTEVVRDEEHTGARPGHVLRRAAG
jgi:N-acyl-D-amino-acid deacylase